MINFFGNKKIFIGTILLAVILASVILVLPNRHRLKVDLPSNYSQPVSLQLARYKLGILPVAAASVQGIVINNGTGKVKYSDVYVETDVELTRFPHKIKEDIILKNPGHPDSFKYSLDGLGQFRVEQDGQGNLIFYRKEKTGDSVDLDRVITIPAPFMIDADGEQSATSAVTMTLVGDILTLIPDAAWLVSHQYPIILDPTIEINILNVHSHPQQGDDWVVSFTTQGQADLKIIPDDQATIDDDVFTSLTCNGEERTPQILPGDVIYYPDWECSAVAQVTHYTAQAGHHTLRFEFGSEVAYAYNVTCDPTSSSNVTFTDNGSGQCEGFITTTGVSQFTVPDDWSNTNKIEVIGGGGAAAAQSGNIPGGGGGGGAYAYVENLSGLSGNINVSVGVGGTTAGANGGNTWFNHATTCASAPVCAGGGAGGTAGNSSSGGTVQAGTGYAGGGGGDANDTTGNGGGGGGGGAAGPGGIGRNGGSGQSGDDGGGGGGAGGGLSTVGEDSGSGATGGEGGYGGAGPSGTGGGAAAVIGSGNPASAGTNGGGGGGGSSDTGNDLPPERGGNGGAGTEWDSTHGAGGGGGGAADGGVPAGSGALYGGGGGGEGEDSASGFGTGGQGLIVITYTIAASNSAPTITSVTDTPDPTNPNRSVSFIVDWNDADSGELVKIKVCKSTNFGSQLCTDGFWASSSAFTTRDPETLVYDIATADHSQTRNYSVFVCDDDAACTSASSGTFTVRNVSNVPDVLFR